MAAVPLPRGKALNNVRQAVAMSLVNAGEQCFKGKVFAYHIQGKRGPPKSCS